MLAVAIPIKIWNSARIEHRLAEQEKLLMAARVEALANQINPHFLFNTLTSISSLIRSQPETARMLIVKLSALLRRLLRSQEHFVTLREELAAVDEYLDIERVRFGPSLVVEKEIDEASLDVIVPSMILQPLVENSIKHGLARKVGEGRITIRSLAPRGPRRDRGHRQRRRHARATGSSRRREHGIGLRNVNERLRVIYGAQLRSCKLHSVPGEGTSARIEIPELLISERASRMTTRRRSACSSSTTSSWRGRSCASCSARSAASTSSARPPTASSALRLAGELTPDLMFLDVQMPGLTGFEVARRLIEAEIAPQLVFVTAFDQYAIDAFSVNAVDYLLKPVDAGRLEQTLDRVRRRLASTQAARLPLSPADLERVDRGRPGAAGPARPAGHSRRRAVRPGAGRRGRSRLARSTRPSWW